MSFDVNRNQQLTVKPRFAVYSAAITACNFIKIKFSFVHRKIQLFITDQISNLNRCNVAELPLLINVITGKVIRQALDKAN